MKLQAKFIIAIGAILLCSYSLLLFNSSRIQHDLIYGQARQQARMLHKQIILTRKWVADHNGLYVIKSRTARPNPFLDRPVLQGANGLVYVKRNPAMVTRELSEYASRTTGTCSGLPAEPINSGQCPLTGSEAGQKPGLALLTRATGGGSFSLLPTGNPEASWGYCGAVNRGETLLGLLPAGSHLGDLWGAPR